MLEKNGLYAQPIVLCGKRALKQRYPRLYLFTRRWPGSRV